MVIKSNFAVSESVQGHRGLGEQHMSQYYVLLLSDGTSRPKLLNARRMLIIRTCYQEAVLLCFKLATLASLMVMPCRKRLFM